jgi:hypothetical protein
MNSPFLPLFRLLRQILQEASQTPRQVSYLPAQVSNQTFLQINSIAIHGEENQNLQEVPRR